MIAPRRQKNLQASLPAALVTCFILAATSAYAQTVDANCNAYADTAPGSIKAAVRNIMITAQQNGSAELSLDGYTMKAERRKDHDCLVLFTLLDAVRHKTICTEETDVCAVLEAEDKGKSEVNYISAEDSTMDDLWRKK